MNLYVLIFSVTLLSGLLSMAAALMLFANRRVARHVARLATPFAAGTLLGAAFFDLLPEALERGGEFAALRFAVLGILGFFLLEQYLDWFHHHHEHSESGRRATAPLIIIGDTLHNLIDGVVVGTAFLISPSTGIVTALAVAAHEIPQEVGDFGLLIKLGVERRRVVVVNILSMLATVVGALATFAMGTRLVLPMEALLGLAAGMFIYIAASDLIPTIHAKSRGRIAHIETALLISGVLLIGLITELAHERLDHPAHTPPAQQANP